MKQEQSRQADKIDDIADQLDDVNTSVDELGDKGEGKHGPVRQLKNAVERARDAVDELEDREK